MHPGRELRIMLAQAQAIIEDERAAPVTYLHAAGDEPAFGALVKMEMLYEENLTAWAAEEPMPDHDHREPDMYDDVCDFNPVEFRLEDEEIAAVEVELRRIMEVTNLASERQNQESPEHYVARRVVECARNIREGEISA